MKKKSYLSSIPGFTHKKSLGQHFLYDEELLGDIAALTGVGREDSVLEVGAGPGSLTAALAKRAGKIVAVETDARLLPMLKALSQDHKNIIPVCADILTADLPSLTAELGHSFCVIGNIPYHITTPLLMKLFNSRLSIKRIAVMVQKEAAERICALPGCKAYGMLAVRCKLYGEPQRVLEVPRGRFTPPPNVDSVLVTIEQRNTPLVAVGNEALFLRICRASFTMRRKTMLNNLTAAFSLSRDTALRALTAIGANEQTRGEDLPPEALARLSDILDYNPVEPIPPSRFPDGSSS